MKIEIECLFPQGLSKISQRPYCGTQKAQKGELLFLHQPEAEIFLGGGSDDFGVEGVLRDAF